MGGGRNLSSFFCQHNPHICAAVSLMVQVLTRSIDRKRFNDHTGRPDRLNEWSRSSREARSGLVGPGPRQ